MKRRLVISTDQTEMQVVIFMNDDLRYAGGDLTIKQTYMYLHGFLCFAGRMNMRLEQFSKIRPDLARIHHAFG